MKHDTYTVTHNYSGGAGFYISNGSEYQSPNWVRIDVYIDGPSLVFEFLRNFERSRAALGALLSRAFPEVIFEIEELSPEEKAERVEARRREEEQRLQEMRRRWAEEARLQKIQEIRDSFRELDRKILDLRRQGLSYWGIARRLGVTINKVRWILMKAAQVPDFWERLPEECRPMSREERRSRAKK